MFKFLMVCFAFVLAATTTFAAPILQTTDKEILNNIKNTSKSINSRFHAEVALVLCDTTPKSFEDIKTIVFSKKSVLNGLSEVKANEICVHAVKILCDRYQNFRGAAFEYAETNPSSFDLAMYNAWNEHNLTNTQLYVKLNTLLVKYLDKHTPVIVASVVDRILSLAPVAEVNTQKEDLQKLNRLLSPLVLKDKAAYEPIVSKIRTVLVTY